jgi:hypothetical protein
MTLVGNGAGNRHAYLGRSVAHRKLDKRQRACLAANLADGLATLQPTIVQAAMLLGVSPAYVAQAQCLTPERRAAILSGSDATSFHALLDAPKRLALPAPVSNTPNLELHS